MLDEDGESSAQALSKLGPPYCHVNNSMTHIRCLTGLTPKVCEEDPSTDDTS